MRAPVRRVGKWCNCDIIIQSKRSRYEGQRITTHVLGTLIETQTVSPWDPYIRLHCIPTRVSEQRVVNIAYPVISDDET